MKKVLRGAQGADAKTSLSLFMITNSAGPDIISARFFGAPYAMSTERCIAKLNKSARHALSMIESGQITNTRRTAPCFIRKSAAQIALAVLPVPCSLKQNARLFIVRNDDVVR